MPLSERGKKIIWNDTQNDIYSNESIARRILAISDDDSDIVERLTGFTLAEQEELHNKNIEAIRKVREKVYEAYNFLDLEDWMDEFFSCNPNQEFPRVFGISPEQFELLAQDEAKIRNRKNRTRLV